tara:strand:- start:151 stop:855 length:705 start_codon:yes stop_codon:yes gene_type:complete
MRIKRGGFSHVEAILSFVIFFGFLIFAFLFFSPFETGRTLKSSLDFSVIEINQYAEAEIESYSIVFDTTNTGTIGIDLARPSINHQAIVERSDGTGIGYVFSGNAIHFQKPGNDFIKITYGYDFVGLTGTGTGGILVEGSEYEISSSDKRNVYTENNFTKLKNSYETDYLGLKTEFNIPNRVDFGFILRYDDGTGVEAENEIPDNFEVLSQVDRIEVITGTGEIKFADLIVKVW